MDEITESRRICLSPKQAAKVMGISEPTLYQLLHRADFPNFKIGKRRLIPENLLIEWCNQQATNGGTE